MAPEEKKIQDENIEQDFFPPSQMMQTVLIPLKLFNTEGVSINNIRRIRFDFFRPLERDEGETDRLDGDSLLFIDDIQLVP
ncbi:MAG: hypothetical protein V3V08_14000 [Nannocystaceae bacterium]